MVMSSYPNTESGNLESSPKGNRLEAGWSPGGAHRVVGSGKKRDVRKKRVWETKLP